MENLYKREICINCANKKCKNRIKVTRTQDLVIEQISTITTIKCDDFICKKKRKKILPTWQKWQGGRKMRKWTKQSAEAYIKTAKEKGLKYWSAIDFLKHHKTMRAII